jgi:hypothetical protein
MNVFVKPHQDQKVIRKALVELCKKRGVHGWGPQINITMELGVDAPVIECKSKHVERFTPGEVIRIGVYTYEVCKFSYRTWREDMSCGFVHIKRIAV